MAIIETLLNRAINSLGANSAWLSWIGGTVLADGLAHIHTAEVEADASTPYARVDWAPRYNIQRANLHDNELAIEGSFLIAFYDLYPKGMDDQSAYRAFLEKATDVCAQLLYDADEDLPTYAFRPVDGPIRTDQDHRHLGDFIAVIMEVDINGEPEL